MSEKELVQLAEDTLRQEATLYGCAALLNHMVDADCLTREEFEIVYNVCRSRRE